MLFLSVIYKETKHYKSLNIKFIDITHMFLLFFVYIFVHPLRVA
jgi:hypothetical protein